MTRAIRSFLDMSGSLAMLSLLFIVLLNFTMALSRYAFPLNFILLYELSLYLHAATIVLGCAFALLDDRHVRLDIFRNTNRQTFIEYLGFFLFAVPLLSAIGYYGMLYAWDSISILEGSIEYSGLPALFLVKSLIPLFAFLMLLACILLLFLWRQTGRRL